MWVRITNPVLGRYQPIVSRYPRYAAVAGTGNSMAEFDLQVQMNGNLNFFMGGGSSNPNKLGVLVDCGFNIIRSNTWTHVALSISTPTGQVNPNAVNIYINGQWQCGWQASAATPFSGTRQVLHGQPFAFSNYENVESNGVPQTFSGRMDEIRLWSGVRTPAQIAANYNLPVSPNSPNLICYLKLDREYPEATYALAKDSSIYANDAILTGWTGTLPVWTGYSAPVQHVITTTNFKLTTVPLYTFSSNPEDYFVCVITTPLQNGDIYLDPLGTQPYSINNPIGPAPNASYPVVWILSRSTVSYNQSIIYFATAINTAGTEVFSTTEQGSLELATIQLFVTANGCDGHGSKIDRCGVCAGNGTSCPPTGCDGVGGQYDLCGVCNGNNTCLSGCDNQPYSTATVDRCGVCKGNNTCLSGCDMEPYSTKSYDLCGVCGGSNSCVGCDGVAWSNKTYDQCGICEGNNSCLSGCDNKPYSNKTYDQCGVCGGNGLSCVCTLTEWRGKNASELDQILLYYQLDALLDQLTQTYTSLAQLTLALSASINASQVSCAGFANALQATTSFNQQSLAYSNAYLIPFLNKV
jgi:hypothetical protein